MRIKMGTTVHLDADQTAYRKAITDALRRELGPTHQAIKTVMRWTGASERTAKLRKRLDLARDAERLVDGVPGRIVANRVEGKV